MKRFFCLIFCCFIFAGCGADDPTTPGEEVVSDTWIDPIDIGGTFLVGGVRVGETVLLETGEEHTMTRIDLIDQTTGEELLIIGERRPDPQNPGAFDLFGMVKGRVVPKGPPVVVIKKDIVSEEGGGLVERSYIQCKIAVDRVLEYNLLVYVEIQEMMVEEVGGEVHRRRELLIIPKGIRNSAIISAGEGYGVKQASISILSHTEMEEIPLPFEIKSEHLKIYEVNEFGHYLERTFYSPQYKVLLKDHIFRPYRIRSLSFLMGVQEIERNW